MKTNTKKELSIHAQAAKAIRDHAKSLGIKCRATSDSYSMGSSVDWEVNDIHPDTFKKLEEFANQYQYGHFNGMEDIYESSNSRDDLPQVKHVFGKNRFSDEITEKAWQWLRVQCPGNAKPLPDNYEDAKDLNFYSGEKDYNHNQMVRNEVWNILRGDDFHCKNWRDFWATLAPAVAEINPAVKVEGIQIEEHTHTKKGFQMFICICPQMSKEDYFKALDQARGAGGWYSRKWGTTPGGFAFKDKSSAEAFAQSLDVSSTPETHKEEIKPATAKATTNHAKKLRGLADKLQKQIDDKRGPRLTNTPKRLKEANSARCEADRLERTQKALYALACLHDAGNVSPLLAGFVSKKSVYDAMAEKNDLIQNGWHCYYSGTGKPASNTPEVLALWNLLDDETEERKAEKALQSKVEALQFSKIPGYFPTPKPVLDLMLKNVDIKPGDKVLEPSAGSGAILDAITAAQPGAILECCESNYSLREILTLKGFELIEHDFMDLQSGQYDFVLMNPPFENLQDVEHVRHAFNMLKPGGRLVAIMSPSAFFRMDKKSESFRSWFYELNGLESDLPENSFKASGTGVNSKIIVLDK